MSKKEAENREKTIEDMKFKNKIQLLRLRAEGEFGIKPGHEYTKEERIRKNIDYMLWLEKLIIKLEDEKRSIREEVDKGIDHYKKLHSDFDIGKTWAYRQIEGLFKNE